jgi:hypothetical protein
MDLTCNPSPPNARRIKRLTLEANSFEEERILQALFDVMDFGGSVSFEINESGAFPARDVTCDFKGEPYARD